LKSGWRRRGGIALNLRLHRHRLASQHGFDHGDFLQLLGPRLLDLLAHGPGGAVREGDVRHCDAPAVVRQHLGEVGLRRGSPRCRHHFAVHLGHRRFIEPGAFRIGGAVAGERLERFDLGALVVDRHLRHLRDIGGGLEAEHNPRHGDCAVVMRDHLLDPGVGGIDADRGLHRLVHRHLGFGIGAVHGHFVGGRGVVGRLFRASAGAERSKER